MQLLFCHQGPRLALCVCVCVGVRNMKCQGFSIMLRVRMRTSALARLLCLGCKLARLAFIFLPTYLHTYLTTFASFPSLMAGGGFSFVRFSVLRCNRISCHCRLTTTFLSRLAWQHACECVWLVFSCSCLIFRFTLCHFS